MPGVIKAANVGRADALIDGRGVYWEVDLAVPGAEHYSTNVVKSLEAKRAVGDLLAAIRKERRLTYSGWTCRYENAEATTKLLFRPAPGGAMRLVAVRTTNRATGPVDAVRGLTQEDAWQKVALDRWWQGAAERIERGRRRLKSGHVESAIQVLTEAVERFPSHALARVELAAALVAGGEPKRAQRVVEHLLIDEHIDVAPALERVKAAALVEWVTARRDPPRTVSKWLGWLVRIRATTAAVERSFDPAARALVCEEAGCRFEPYRRPSAARLADVVGRVRMGWAATHEPIDANTTLSILRKARAVFVVVLVTDAKAGLRVRASGSVVERHLEGVRQLLRKPVTPPPPGAP